MTTFIIRFKLYDQIIKIYIKQERRQNASLSYATFNWKHVTRETIQSHYGIEFEFIIPVVKYSNKADRDVSFNQVVKQFQMTNPVKSFSGIKDCHNTVLAW